MALHFHYEALKTPVMLKVELVHPQPSSGKPKISTQDHQFDKSSSAITIGFCFTEEDESGEYHIRAYFNGKLFKETKVSAIALQ